jgi:hypothetical protein
MPKSSGSTPGHFALDENNDDIASLVLAFLAKHPRAALQRWRGCDHKSKAIRPAPEDRLQWHWASRST